MTFSKRLAWDVAENGLAEVERVARRDVRFVDLSVSNPTAVELPGAKEARAEIAEALATAARTGVYAPSAQGGAAAREAIAASYGAGGSEIAAERLLLTASSSESYSFLFKLLCNPGDAVLVPTPSYPLFEYLARLEAVQPIPYRLSQGMDRRWRVDLHSVDEAFARLDAEGRRVPAVVVVSPNNPTGSVLDAADADALDARCAARDAALISDEVFADFIRHPSPSHVRCLAARKTAALAFSLGGLSKSCGQPQLKLGWIAVGGPAPAARHALDRLALIADTYLSVNAATEGAASALLGIGARVRGHLEVRLRANEIALARAIGTASPLTALPSEGGWAAILRVPAVLSDEAWTRALLEHERVLVQPGYFFDLDRGAHLVVSLLPPEAAFADGLGRAVGCIEALTLTASGSIQ